MSPKYLQYFLFFLGSLFPITSFAQGSEIDTSTWHTQPGIVGTIILCIIVLLVFAFIMILRLGKLLNVSEKAREKQRLKDLKNASIDTGTGPSDGPVRTSQQEGGFQLVGDELAGQRPVVIRQGLVQKVTHNPNNPLADEKKMGNIKVQTD